VCGWQWADHQQSAEVLRAFLVVFVVLFAFRDILKLISQVCTPV